MANMERGQQTACCSRTHFFTNHVPFAQRCRMKRCDGFGSFFTVALVALACSSSSSAAGTGGAGGEEDPARTGSHATSSSGQGGASQSGSGQGGAGPSTAASTGSASGDMCSQLCAAAKCPDTPACVSKCEQNMAMGSPDCKAEAAA